MVDSPMNLYLSSPRPTYKDRMYTVFVFSFLFMSNPFRFTSYRSRGCLKVRNFFTSFQKTQWFDDVIKIVNIYTCLSTCIYKYPDVYICIYKISYS